MSENIQPQPIENPTNFKKEVFVFAWETFKIVIISLAIILPIRYYLVQPFFVNGASMESNFEDGDYLLVDEITYRFEEPKRGEVIVFHFPKDESQFFIKRIIGLPGETIEIKNDTVTIFNEENKNGIILGESYLDNHQITHGDIRYQLKNNEFYVLGDNRLQSADSRRWGPVSRDEIVGRVLIRAWPLDKFSKIPQIRYTEN